MLKLRLPNGEEVASDRVMALNVWANYLKGKSNQTMLFAGMGRPTYPPSLQLAASLSGAAGSLVTKSYESRQLLIEEEDEQKRNSSTTENFTYKTLEAMHNKGYAAIDYGLPDGDYESRKLMSQALNRLYGLRDNREILPEHLLFTNGGSSALYCSFNVINQAKPNGRIITPAPFYSLHAHNNRLHLIDVLNLPGYKLNAAALKQAIQEVKQQAARDNSEIGGFIFCYPHNPTGLTLDREEWQEIAQVLNDPELQSVPIILDEAYAEMRIDNKPHCSLFVVAPELEDRIILLRTGTKTMSAAGERMAVVICKNPTLLNKIKGEHVNINGHASRANSKAYACAMFDFKEDEQQRLVRFYRETIHRVQTRLVEIAANFPNQVCPKTGQTTYVYKVTGTFYVLADLSDLLGLPLHPEAKKALPNTDLIENDEALVYHLLFDQGIMLAPLSYFGSNPKKGYVRITCSDIVDCNAILERLNTVLIATRKQKCVSLIETKIKRDLLNLTKLNPGEAQRLIDEFSSRMSGSDIALKIIRTDKKLAKDQHMAIFSLDYNIPNVTAAELKLALVNLQALSLSVGTALLVHTDKNTADNTKRGQTAALARLKPFVTMLAARQKADKFRKLIDQAWFKWVELNLPKRSWSGEKQLPLSERAKDYPAWAPIFTKLFELFIESNLPISTEQAIIFVIDWQTKGNFVQFFAHQDTHQQALKTILSKLAKLHPGILSETHFFSKPPSDKQTGDILEACDFSPRDKSSGEVSDDTGSSANATPDGHLSAESSSAEAEAEPEAVAKQTTQTLVM